HQIGEPIGESADVEHFDDVRVADGGGGPGLVDEAAHQVLVLGELALEYLHRDAAVEERMVGEVHAAHTSFTYQGPDLVVVDPRPYHTLRSRHEARRAEVITISCFGRNPGLIPSFSYCEP